MISNFSQCFYCWSNLQKLIYHQKISNQFLLIPDMNRRKVEIFNTFLAKQCTPINTCNDLPTTLTKNTHESPSTFCFTSDDILKIIKNLDPNKTCSHDMISIQMVKLCNAFLCKPLKLMFKSCLESRNFLLNGKKLM